MKSPFGNATKVQALIAVFLLVLIAAFATRCHAVDLQFAGGTAVVRGATPALDLSVTFPNVVHDAGIQVGATLVGAADFRGEQPHQMAWQALLVDGFRQFDIGVGAAWLQNEDAFNSSHVNFSLMIGYRFRVVPVTVLFRHWSNAGTRGGNLGRDLLLLGWRF